MLAKQTIRGGVVVLLGLMVVLGGCSQPLNKREKGALVGGGLGAASGAIIGATVGAPGRPQHQPAPHTSRALGRGARPVVPPNGSMGDESALPF